MAPALALIAACVLLVGCSEIVPVTEREGIPVVITNRDDEAATIEIRQSLPDHQGEVPVGEEFDLEPGASTTVHLPPTLNVDADGWFMITVNSYVAATSQFMCGSPPGVDFPTTEEELPAGVEVFVLEDGTPALDC